MPVKRRIGELVYHDLKSDVSLDDSGYVLKLLSDGKVDKVAAGDSFYGINYKSTENPFKEGEYLKGVRIGIVRDAGVAMVKLLGTNAAISIGDFVGTAAGGTVDKLTHRTDTIANLLADLKATVGIALESKSASAGGKIKVALRRIF